MNITVDVASTMSAAAAPEADAEPSSTSTDDPRAKALLMNTSSFANRLATGERPKERDQKLIKQVEAMTGTPTPAGNGDVVIGGDNRHVHFKEAPSTLSIRSDDGETTEGADEAQDKPTDTSASVDVSARGDNGGTDDAETEDKPTDTSTSMDTGGDDSGPFHSSWNNKSDTNNNKNAPDSWGEYIAYFFNKAEVCQYYYLLLATLFLQCCLQCYAAK